jgi:Ras-related protein Rab-5C
MTFKVVLVGDIAVGKSCIIYRFTHDEFDPTLAPTLGSDAINLGMTFSKKLIERNNMKLMLEIWDTAGQEKYKMIAPIYYRNAQAVIIVYDASKPSSAKDAVWWVDEVATYHSPMIGGQVPQLRLPKVPGR